MRTKLKFTTAILGAALLFLQSNAAALGSTNYVLDTDGKTQIATPITHQVTEVYDYFGAEGGMLKKPSDLFVSKDDCIYIADTENNRIVKLDQSGKYIRSFTDSGRLNAPGGVFVSDQGDLFVGDTQNERIVHLDQEDRFIEEFKKPKSEMLDSNMDFQVSRLGISEQGYIYLIKGQHFMTIDANNEFKGYVGANELGFSLIRTLIRAFASREQQERLLKEEPPAYNSFDIGADGMVYATTAETKNSGQIRKINAVGVNIYPEKTYGETYYNEQTKVFNNPRFVDIAVEKSGIVYVLEQYRSCVYAYDQEGNLLTVFGGSGKIKGRFEVPNSIDINSNGDVFVLDGSTGYIHRFSRTDFMANIISAVDEYNNGKYQEAYASWQKVLQIDANYPVANRGIAQALYKDGRMDEAMEYYELAEDKSGYGAAFSERRYELFRAYFGWLVLAGVVIIIGIIILIVWLKKRADRMVGSYYQKGNKS